MRRLSSIFLFTALLLCSHKSEGLYLGNPSFPIMPEKGLFLTNSWLSFKGGYEFDDVFDLQLKMEDSASFEDKKIKKYTSRCQLGVLTLNLADRVELYSGLGRMSSTLNQRVNNNKLHYQTNTDFAWSIGGRTLFAYWGDLQFGLAASYLQFSPDLSSITLNHDSLSHRNAQLRYRQWQVGAGISYHVMWLFPYIGLKYSNVNAKYFQLNSLQFLFPNKEFTLKSKKTLGIVLGCGLAPEKALSINIEGRFIDETAFTVSADIRF